MGSEQRTSELEGASFNWARRGQGGHWVCTLITAEQLPSSAKFLTHDLGFFQGVKEMQRDEFQVTV